MNLSIMVKKTYCIYNDHERDPTAVNPHRHKVTVTVVLLVYVSEHIAQSLYMIPAARNPSAQIPLPPSLSKTQIPNNAHETHRCSLIKTPKDLVMEQPHTLLDKGDTQFLRRLEDGVVVLAAGGRGDVFGAGTGGAEDVVDEGELNAPESA